MVWPCIVVTDATGIITGAYTVTGRWIWNWRNYHKGSLKKSIVTRSGWTFLNGIIWKKARNYSTYKALSREDVDEATRLICRITTDLRARAYIKATECLKNRKIQQINIATTEALITYELRQRGFMFSFNWQKLRVKVSIKLECGSAMTFIVKYKDIREGKLLQIMDEVMAVVEPLNKTKTNITVWPLSGSWRTWNGWKA